MRPPRVGVVGGRRARMGLGPFLIRELRAAGAEVPGFVVRRPEGLAAAERSLAAPGTPAPRGHLSLESLLRAGPLDALAILSPHATHAGFLQAALEHGLHVLCEKPLVWDLPDLAGEARRLTEGFRSRGLLLWENCQWPYTLAAYRRLHPAAPAAAPRRFRMFLQPPAGGPESLADCLPHPLSLLQALAPGERPRLDDVRLRCAGDDGLDVRFRYCADAGEVETLVELRPTRARLREIWLEIDGRRARRVVVSRDDYRLAFEDGERQVPLPDPLALLVRDFVAELRGGDARAAGRPREIATRMALLEQLARAHREARA